MNNKVNTCSQKKTEVVIHASKRAKEKRNVIMPRYFSLLVPRKIKPFNLLFAESVFKSIKSLNRKPDKTNSTEDKIIWNIDVCS